LADVELLRLRSLLPPPPPPPPPPGDDDTPPPALPTTDEEEAEGARRSWVLQERLRIRAHVLPPTTDADVRIASDLRPTPSLCVQGVRVGRQSAQFRGHCNIIDTLMTGCVCAVLLICSPRMASLLCLS
jgi:hypothetical protein